MASKVSARSEQISWGSSSSSSITSPKYEAYASIEEYTYGKAKALFFIQILTQDLLADGFAFNHLHAKAWTCVKPILFEPSASVTSHDHSGVLFGLHND